MTADTGGSRPVAGRAKADLPRDPRLNVASLDSSPPTTSDLIKPDDWSKIESLYGHPLGEEIRTQIAKATDRLLEFSAFAHAAPRLSTSLDRAESIKKAAASLIEVLCTQQQDDAIFHADRLVRKQLEIFTGKTTSLAGVADLMSSLVAACEKTKTELEEGATSRLRADDHWKHWVRRVSRIVELHNLPATVRHDRNGNLDWRPSSFVVLIEAIQEYLPAHAGRRAATIEALSKAVSSAQSDYRGADSGILD
jgi:hypothetical protein